MKPIRLAMIGLGKIARDQHLPAIAATPGIEIAAVASRNASLDGVAHFATLEELLEQAPDIDAVALCTPPQVRRAQAAAALTAGKHVLLEKPPGATVSELGPLTATARGRGRTLFATWHSRFAPAIETARAILARQNAQSVTITWKEDVRIWHPGQGWIFEPGGLGVFDPGINALSILTAILPEPVFVTRADLAFPANRQAPIAADIEFTSASGVPVRAAFDFRQTGEQKWSIEIETETGPLLLSSGGTRLSHSGRMLIDEAEREYAGIYRRFVLLIREGRSDVRPCTASSGRRCLHARAAPYCRTIRGLNMRTVEALGAVVRDLFGHLPDGRAVERVLLRGTAGFEVSIITYGAAVQALHAPDRNGQLADLVLGHDAIEPYLSRRDFFGATVGRYANRIARASFVLDGVRRQLSANDAKNTLHGGAQGFDRALWTIEAAGDGPEPFVTLGRVSPDGEEGFPGTVTARVTYRITADQALAIAFEATTDQPTVVNLTHHGYFNLGGRAEGSDILDHELTLFADRFLPIDADLIPLRKAKGVTGTPFDFRSPRPIGESIRDGHEQLSLARGYDHCFLLAGERAASPQLAARVVHPASGRAFDLLTDQPGIQFYSGNFLDGTVKGKRGRLHRQSDAFCLEPQFWPNAPNRPDFPSARLDPGETYRHVSIFRFYTV